MGTHDFKYNKEPLFLLGNQGISILDVCCPETSSCASKPLLLRCSLFIPQCMCQVVVKIERGSDGDQ